MVDVSSALASELMKTLDTVPELPAETMPETSEVELKKKVKPKRFQFSDRDVLFHEELMIVEGYRVPNALYHFATISKNPKRIKFNGEVAPELLSQLSSPVLSSTDSSEILKSIKTPVESAPCEKESCKEDQKAVATADSGEEHSLSFGSRRPSSASIASTASRVTIITRKLTGTSENSDGSVLDRTSSSSSLESGAGAAGPEKMGDIIDRLFAMNLRMRRVGSELKLKHIPKSEPSLIWRVLGIARIRVKDVKEADS